MKKLFSLLLACLMVLGVTSTALGEATPLELRYMYSTDSFDPETDITRKLILEELNVNIIPEMYSSSDQITLILSSNQPYDMIKVTDTSLLATYAEAHAITDLTDLIMAHPDFYNLFSPEIWNTVSVDGRIYAIPETDTSDLEWGIAVRTDWLEKCNLEAPTTVEEFYNMLVAFSKLNPADLGVDYIIPFTMPGVNTTLGTNGLIQAFGLGGDMHSFVEDADGNLKSSYELPGGKAYLTFLNRLYKEGLLDADFPTNQNANVVERLASGVAGSAIFCCWDSAALDTLKANFPNANLTYLQPLTLPGYEENGRIHTRGGLKNYLIVPSTSTKAEEVVQFCIDFMDDAHYTRLILGDEGVHYEVRDGSFYPIFPAFNDMNKGRWFYPTNVGEKYTPLFAVRAHKEESMGYLWDDINRFREDYGYLEVTRTAPLLPAYSENIGTLTSLSQEYLIKAILDENELANYDAFVQTWLDNGGAAWTKELNDWYQTIK